MEKTQDRIRGCLFGGAVGDALGYPVEFMNEEAIWNRYGKPGISEYAKDTRTGRVPVSDDTQMTLFTANGLLNQREKEPGCDEQQRAVYIYEAYLDWLTTQEVSFANRANAETTPVCRLLMEIPELYAKRAPGLTCLKALQDLRIFSKDPYTDIFKIRNDRKGCGGIMRVAPVAFADGGENKIEQIDRDAGNAALITHCHSLGYMPAAVLAHIIYRIVYDPANEKQSLEDIIEDAKNTVAKIYAGDENLPKLISVINRAVKLTGNDKDDITNIHSIGEGWVAEETLGIALYCALRYRDDFSAGVIAAVNHKGDSDSTGAVAGNILGALCGYEAIEDKWKAELELKEVILEMADHLGGIKK